MKNLFSNQWVIAGLCVIAIAMLVRSVTQPFSEVPVYEDDVDEYDWLDDSGSSEQSIMSGERLSALSTENLYWNTHPQRDPFNSSSYSRQGEIKRKNQAIGKTGDITEAKPVLSALVAGQVSRFAVINGVIVREGDYVAGYRIHSIAPNGVWLGNRGGKRTLHLVFSGN